VEVDLASVERIIRGADNKSLNPAVPRESYLRAPGDTML